MKKENIFWGLFFILGGVFLIISRLDILEGFSFLTLFFTILLAAWLIRSIRYIDFGGILFSIAFLCILYDDFLGIERLTPWPVLGAAAFGTIGLSMIFKDRVNHEYREGDCFVKRPDGSHFSSSTEEVTDNEFTFSTSFSSSAKYVRSDDFTNARINCSFGSMKVYFDDAMIQQGNATINLDVKFGGVDLFIPKTWNVINRACATFGGIDEKNRSVTNGTPTVTLTGDVAFGGVTITYC